MPLEFVFYTFYILIKSVFCVFKVFQINLITNVVHKTFLEHCFGLSKYPHTHTFFINIFFSKRTSSKYFKNALKIWRYENLPVLCYEY